MTQLIQAAGAPNKTRRKIRKEESEYLRLRRLNAELLEVAQEALWFLQNGEIQPNGERHPHTMWYETVRRLRRLISENG
jgi:hypothetical protein